MPSLAQLNKACKDARIHFDLTTFNAQYANQSKAQYLDALQIELKKRIKTQQHATFIKADETWSIRSSLTNSLAYMFHQVVGEKEDLENKTLFVKKIADAHAFIQATGFSTQNEASYLSMLDMINYYRMHDKIAEAKFMLYSLAEPFEPLVREYQSIATHEPNVLLKATRTLLPMTIVASTVIGVSFILSNIIIPDIAFFFILLPTVYVGLFVATQYVNFANSLYHSLRQSYYGGLYEVPEFQVQAAGRIDVAYMSDKNKIKAVQSYYVQEIKNCDALEHTLSRKHLTTDELKQRDENLQRRHLLQLEWYDLQENKKIGIDKIPEIALHRIQNDGLETTKTYCHEQVQIWMRAVEQSLDHKPVRSTFFSNNKIKELISLESTLTHNTF